MSESYRYLAFISYKREDEEWAKWLQHKLEHYKLPTAVRKANPSLPDRIRPIFKDTTDLSGGVLEKAIKDALESSKYLIVICSPLAAHSPWVCKEVQEFIDTGREEFIIPFIVEGEPHSRNIVNECFPQNLRDLSGSRELLGININEMGRDAAAIKVAARMFDLHFDELWQRWERENRIRRRIVVAVSLLGAIVGLAIAGIMFYQNRKILINRARAVAYRATHLVEQGNSYLARKVLVEAMSEVKSINSIPEVESALRAACADNSWAYKFNGVVHSVKYSPDASELAVGVRYYYHEEDTIRISVVIMDPSNGEVLQACYGHSDDITCVAYSPDGNYIASASADKTIRIWDINDNYNCVKILEGHERKVRSVSFSPDGKHLASASDDRTIRIWDINDNYNCIKIIDKFKFYVTSVSYSSNGECLLSSSADFSVDIWDVNDDYKCIKSLMDSNGSLFDISQSVYSASFSSDGRYIAAALIDKTIRIWDVYNNYQCITLNGHEGEVFSASFSSDGRYMLSASKDETIRIWDIADGYQCKHILKGHQNAVIYAAFSPDGKNVISGSADGTVHLWDLESKDYVRTIDEYRYPASCVSFSMSDRYVVTKLYDTLQIYDANQNYRCVKKNKCKDYGSIQMSNVGKYVGRYHSGLVIGDINSEEYFREIGKPGRPSDFSISSDGRYVASVSGDSTIHVFDGLRDYEEVELVSKKARRIKSVSFSPEGKYIVAASDDGYVSVWKTSILNPHFMWETSKYKLCLIISTYQQEGMCAIIAFNGESVAYWSRKANGQIFLFNKFSNKEIVRLSYPAGIVCARFSPDGKYIVSGYNNGTICIWDVYSHRCVRELKGHTESVGEVSFSQDGRYIVSSSSDKTIKVWEFMPLHELVDSVQEQFKNNPLSDSERREYYLE